MLNVIRSCDNHMGNVMSNKETSGGPVNELKTYQTTVGCGMLFFNSFDFIVWCKTFCTVIQKLKTPKDLQHK
jgi:hypothetical protein